MTGIIGAGMYGGLPSSGAVGGAGGGASHQGAESGVEPIGDEHTPMLPHLAASGIKTFLFPN